VETPGAHAKPRRSREGFAALALRSINYCGGWWTSSTRLSILHGSHPREPRALGVRCTGVLASRCASVLGRSVGYRIPSSQGDVERVQPEPVATSVKVPEDLFVPAEVLWGLARTAGQTLYVRRKGMRGQLRWFTPSRLARGLKTAKIGKGHGGSA
jgi:hypothetical protein